MHTSSLKSQLSNSYSVTEDACCPPFMHTPNLYTLYHEVIHPNYT